MDGAPDPLGCAGIGRSKTRSDASASSIQVAPTFGKEAKLGTDP